MRCPNCRKKQEEPYPQRCGCGQSLLAGLAARGGTADVRPSTLKLVRRAIERPRSVHAVVGQSPVPDDNEW